MAISGLVISTRTAAQAAALAETLAVDVRFVCGPRNGNRLAAVMDTTDDAGDEDLCRWLWTHDGVVLVDVAAVHLTPDDHASCVPSGLDHAPSPTCHRAPFVQRHSPNESYHD